MYLLSVYFDEKSTKRIQKYMDDLSNITGNTFMKDHHVPPHLTICAIEARSVEVLLPYVHRLHNLEKGKIEFVSVGAFFPYVLFLTPILNTYLQFIQKEVCAVFSNIPEVKIQTYYQPGNWIAHTTLVKKCSKEQMQEAFIYMQDHFSPFTCQVTKIGLSKVNPHQDVWTMEMNNIERKEKL